MSLIDPTNIKPWVLKTLLIKDTPITRIYLPFVWKQKFSYEYIFVNWLVMQLEFFFCQLQSDVTSSTYYDYTSNTDFCLKINSYLYIWILKNIRCKWSISTRYLFLKRTAFFIRSLLQELICISVKFYSFSSWTNPFVVIAHEKDHL